MAKDLDYMAIGTAGAIAGAVTPFLLKLATPVLNVIGNYVPAVSLKFAEAQSSGTILVNIRQSLTGIQAGLATWLTDALGITVPANVIMSVLTGAVGGALLFIVGALLVNMTGMLEGNAFEKTRNTIFAGHLVAALVLGIITFPLSIGLSFVNVLIAMLINAAILASVYVAIGKQTKGHVPVVPF